MASWGCTPDGDWFGRPSYLGLYAAPDPWGPWEQIHEETAWTPGDDPAARAYQPQIAPAWIAPDGRSFWLVWTDFQLAPGSEDVMAVIEGTTSVRDFWARLRAAQPYYAFNAQRVELTT
jgi:hypothetical protein